MSSLLRLVDNKPGYTIIEFNRSRSLVENEILQHCRTVVNAEICSLSGLLHWISTNDNFRIVKEKKIRIFSREASLRLAHHFLEDLLRPALKGGEFLTDEEQLGYPNIYFRVVRADSSDDVGSAHADRWFWDIREHPFPAGFRRVKIWAPIVQDDSAPSLLLLPESQNERLKYSIEYSSDGRHKPIFQDHVILGKLVPAPVRCGEAVVFNDELLHQGCATSVTRISVEFTVGVPTD